MKTFKVEREGEGASPETLIITLYHPPYEDENILNKTGWKSKDVKITEIKFEEEE
tara:strand:+ start:180 stop:344 length:165 start_codon:yes stop_codon:yes gene_type:complete